MVSWDVAVMAMVGVSAVGFLVADGERRRVAWVRALRRCLLRLSDAIRYERPELGALLAHIDLRATPQERELTRLLRACAQRLRCGENPLDVFSQESARSPGYGVLHAQDREAFEAALSELGRRTLQEQLRLLGEADERLRRREEELSREAGRRAQMIRALSLAGGAAVFLILI